MEERTITEDWWQHIGCASLNRKLSDIAGKGVGDIPLENLELELPQDTDYEVLAELMIRDGLPAITYRYTNGDVDIFIRVR